MPTTTGLSNVVHSQLVGKIAESDGAHDNLFALSQGGSGDGTPFVFVPISQYDHHFVGKPSTTPDRLMLQCLFASLIR